MPVTSATPEWSLLLGACSVIPRQKRIERLRPLLQGTVQWKFLFSLAERNGVQPLLHQALSDLSELVPPEEMRTLQQICQNNMIKTMLVSRELIRIVKRLSDLGIAVIPYKGPALAEVIYRDIALRQSGDIDLLIRPKDLVRARDAVRELGYVPQLALSAIEEGEYLRSGYEYSFDGPAGPNLLELQWAIQPRFYAVDFEMEGLFQRGITVSVAGQPMKTLSVEDLLLVLTVHAAKHVWGRLVWLCDVASLIGQPALNWELVGAHARKLGMVRMLQITMLLANRLLGAEIPDAGEHSLPQEPEALALVDEIAQYIGSESEYNVDSFAYFRLMMRLREKRADRLRLVRRLVLTPGPGEWRALRLPPVLFPLYRLVRFGRLAAKLVGA